MGTTLMILCTIAVIILLLMALELKNKDEFILQLAPIGQRFMPHLNKSVDLTNYLVDIKGNLYSMHPDTWEVNGKDNRDILICSNSSTDKQGVVVNSLRAMDKQKVTIRRNDLKFKTLASENGIVTVTGKLSTPRHIKIVEKFGWSK